MTDLDSTLSVLIQQVATARASRRPLRVRGGNTRAFYGEPAAAGVDVLEVSGYRGIVDYEPSELVLTARAGTSLTEIEAALAAAGQMLAFEPPRFGVAGTLGGCIASGLSGPRRMAAGPLVDYVLGARLLNGGGKLLRFGGEVMKNVAGYDVSRLLAGSLGALGALLEVSLKVVPQPRCEATRVLELDAGAALRACAKWRVTPTPVSATAWLPGNGGAAGTLYVRLSGNESAVRQGVADVGGAALAEAGAETFWLSLRDQTHAFFQQRPLWRVSLPPLTPPLELGPMLHEWAGGLRWLAGDTDAVALRARVAKLGGSVCLYRRAGAPADVPTFQPLQPAVLEIHRRLKRALDPDNVFDARPLHPEL